MIGNFDLSGYPLDGPLPALPETQDGQRSRQQLLTDLAQGENLTIRQLYERIAGGRGHFTVVGTAAAGGGSDAGVVRAGRGGWIQFHVAGAARRFG
jgi:hypothetical protein